MDLEREPGSTGESQTCLEPGAAAGRQLCRLLQADRPALPDRARPGSPADWSRVIDLSRRHGLMALVYRQVRESDAWADIPAAEQERLRLAYYTGADHNMRVYRQLQPALAGLREAGIRVIVLKGACLAEVVYGNIALRSMGDVDLLVPKPELARARAVLVDAGCAHAAGDIETECRVDNQIGSFVRGGLVIDVHWTIERPESPFSIDATGLWDRARPALIAGVEVLTLCPEDLLLHICLHAVYHHGLNNGLQSLCDIARVIQRYDSELDWTGLARSACEWGAARHAGLVFLLARDMMGAGVPGDVIDQLVPEGVDQRVLEAARECILAQSSWRVWVARPLPDVFGAGSLKDKLTVLWRRLFPSRAQLAAWCTSSPGPGLRVLWFKHIVRSCWSQLLRPRLVKLRILGREHDQHIVLADWLGQTERRRQ